jgi:hypothetical protein
MGYWIITSPSLNKLLADRRANVPAMQVKDLISEEIMKVFSVSRNVELIFFPQNSSQTPNIPSLMIVVPSLDQIWIENNRVVNEE